MTTNVVTKIQVLLAPTLMEAQKIAEDCYASEESLITVEAEYGSMVIESNCGLTLAHHVDAYKHLPSPCNRTDVVAFSSPWPDTTVLVSHIDLDTVGGVLRVMLGSDDPLFRGQDAENFWQAAEFVDLNGPHKLPLIENRYVREQLRAVWAWSEKNRAERVTSVADVTEQILGWLPMLRRVVQLGDNELLDAGEAWAKNIAQAVRNCLDTGLSTTKVRVFRTPGVFCSSSYYDVLTGEWADACVVLNTKFNSVTISALDGAFDCCALVQELWGADAGGHKGIAGSPRGQVMGEADLLLAVAAVKEIVG